ncbi:DUF3958 family protein [Listeria valentina]|uniref:DUF3958 family protein n=1 Tax=Listeria valentina TaxID=2705293 RepID=UPI0014302F90|nr:DUF3958 family protein [Listeria valentina]
MDKIDTINGKLFQNRLQQEEKSKQEQAVIQTEETFYGLLLEKEHLQFEIQETWQGSERFPVLQDQQLELKRLQNRVLEELEGEKARIHQGYRLLEEKEEALLRERQQVWTEDEQK